MTMMMNDYSFFFLNVQRIFIYLAVKFAEWYSAVDMPYSSIPTWIIKIILFL